MNAPHQCSQSTMQRRTLDSNKSKAEPLQNISNRAPREPHKVGSVTEVQDVKKSASKDVTLTLAQSVDLHTRRPTGTRRLLQDYLSDKNHKILKDGARHVRTDVSGTDSIIPEENTQLDIDHSDYSASVDFSLVEEGEAGATPAATPGTAWGRRRFSHVTTGAVRNMSKL